MKNPLSSSFKKTYSLLLTAILIFSTLSGQILAANPKVSIIIPVYNTSENLLRGCLESAKNQTLKDIEIICVDDGSTNESGKILDEYAKNDTRFVVVHQENGGISAARDKGMELATGEYIQFLDHDDTIDSTMSEKCYDAAKKFDADIIKQSTFYKMPFTKIINNKQIYIFGIFENVWNGIYRKKFLNNNNLKFGQLLGAGGEDALFNCECLSLSNKIVILPEKLYSYNRHVTQTSILTKTDNKRTKLCCDNIRHMSQKILEKYSNNYNIKFMFLNCCFSMGRWCNNFKDIIAAIGPELLQDDVINLLPTKERIQLRNIIQAAKSE